MTTRVLSVVSEAYPLVKTGGLGDVAGALPAALAPHDVRVTTLIPGYPAVMKALEKRSVLRPVKKVLGVQTRLVAGEAAGLDLIVLEAPEIFKREGGPYSDTAGRDWPDNWLRYAVLGRAAADLAEDSSQGFELVHAHDWQGAMACAYLRYDRSAVPSLVTIHNISFPGWFPAQVFADLDLPATAFAMEGVEYYGGVSYLKAGLWAADAISTVSPTYAEEIRTAAFGMGFEGLIQTRRANVSGIVNGIDTDVWNPETDANLPATYDARTLHQRKANKHNIETAFGVADGNGPLLCVVSRLTGQKGMDVLAVAIDDLVAMGGRLALLGSGDAELELAFKAAAVRHPGKVGVKIGYDEVLSHRLQGGADAILIPSRFEPCGLTQMYGLRYGCVPVAARTGGLSDTIIDANEAALSAGVATGFLFDDLTPDGLTRALQRAVGVFADRSAWRGLQEQGMKANFSWAHSGAKYAELYRRLIKPAARRTTARKTARR
jgi:starch synthase